MIDLVCKQKRREMIGLQERYCEYLIDWALTHRDAAYEGMTPACFDEWSDCENEEEIEDDR